ncbi:MAG: ATP-binding cassette domain-containing protein [Lachnospiraceae bacterium]|nr:ATP-binding cassette domain-containing protein [Lachnospiraceae bacterium]
MIEIEHLSKSFRTADGTTEALKDVSLRVETGDIFGIIGMSGAGKSTLVRCINLLERPTSGRILLDGTDLSALHGRALREKRREIAMIFQGFHLLMQRTCLQNVCFPLELAGARPAAARERALELLGLVGLADKAQSYPAQLSGGQQQRVAIARALAAGPKLLLCDEATSALDPTTTASILALIREINEKMGITAIVITHQMSVVESICRRVAILDGGEVVEQGNVSEIFARPASAAARRLVFPEGEAESAVIATDDRHFIRVVFNGAKATATPLIARMALEQGIEANIAYASTRSLSDKMFGSMLLSFPEKEQARGAIEYLTRMPDVIAEEVEPHVC